MRELKGGERRTRKPPATILRPQGALESHCLAELRADSLYPSCVSLSMAAAISIALSIFALLGHVRAQSDDPPLGLDQVAMVGQIASALAASAHCDFKADLDVVAEALVRAAGPRESFTPRRVARLMLYVANMAANVEVQWATDADRRRNCAIYFNAFGPSGRAIKGLLRR